MNFEIVHEFDLPLGALSLAVISPELCRRFARRHPSAKSIEQETFVLNGGVLERVWSCRADVEVPMFARTHVTAEMMEWREASTYVLEKHAAEWTVLPSVKPEWQRYFSSSGTYVLTAPSRGRARRTVRGTLELRVPVLRHAAESSMVRHVRKIFDAEADALRELATFG